MTPRFVAGPVVRETPTTVEIQTKLHHVEGAPINVSGTAKQLRIETFMTDSIPDINATSIFKEVSHTIETELPGVTNLSQASPLVFNMSATISHKNCSKVQFICITLTTTAAATFFETNLTNNFQCQDIKSNIVCKPCKYLA